ncbi:PP2C family protein-serine/threonine phosphatase [Streptomyces sp. NPDC047971]|uniref:PP2C family protein-serine/threonine phosphatase n=1 Tax=Streptomyces sp. NPDC047971 TaxID=3154499 RepID=UPI0033CC4FFE
MDRRLTGVQEALGGRTNALRLSLLLPVLLIVFGVLFHVTTPAQLTGTPFFVSAPLMAAPLYTWWATLFFGGAGLVATALLNLVAGSMWEPAVVQDLATELATIGFVTAIALLLNRVVRRGRARLASARGAAEAAQRAVLPTPPERLDGLHLVSHYEAAVEDTLVGGDLYAARSTPFGVRLVMGDVRGKGLGSIETVSVILGSFWEAADRDGTLVELAGSLERALARESVRRSGFDDTEAFATCVLVEIPPGHDVVRVLNLGHPPPLLFAGDGKVLTLAPGSYALPLGLSELAPTPREPDEWSFPPESTLLLYTDGLSEARGRDGVFYDPAARLGGRTFSSPVRLLGALVGDVKRYADGLTGDDMALLAAHRPRAVR